MRRRSSQSPEFEPVRFEGDKMSAEVYKARRDRTTKQQLRRLESTDEFKRWTAEKARSYRSYSILAALVVVSLLVLGCGSLLSGRSTTQAPSASTKPILSTMDTATKTEGKNTIEQPLQAVPDPAGKAHSTADKLSQGASQASPPIVKHASGSNAENQTQTGGKKTITPPVPTPPTSHPAAAVDKKEDKLSQAARRDLEVLQRENYSLQQDLKRLEEKLLNASTASELALKAQQASTQSAKNSLQDEEDHPLATLIPSLAALVTISVGLVGYITKDRQLDKVQQAHRTLKDRCKALSEAMEQQEARCRGDIAGLQKLNNEYLGKVHELTGKEAKTGDWAELAEAETQQMSCKLEQAEAAAVAAQKETAIARQQTAVMKSKRDISKKKATEWANEAVAAQREAVRSQEEVLAAQKKADWLQARLDTSESKALELKAMIEQQEAKKGTVQNQDSQDGLTKELQRSENQVMELNEKLVEAKAVQERLRADLAHARDQIRYKVGAVSELLRTTKVNLTDQVREAREENALLRQQLGAIIPSGVPVVAQ